MAASISLSHLSRSPWFHFLGGAILWSAHFLVTYGWVELACQTNLLALHSIIFGLTVLSWTVFGFALVAALTALYVGWSSYQSWKRIKKEQQGDELTAWGLESRKFMAFSGIFLSTLFALTILLSGLTALVLGPCTG